LPPLARLVTVEQACRQLGVETEPFVEALNAARQRQTTGRRPLPMIAACARRWSARAGSSGPTTAFPPCPTPTKFLWFANVNLFNNAKHAYDMLFVVNPKIDCIIAQDVEMTSSCEYADLVYPANTWMEFTTYEITASCSNPYLQIWKGGIRPVYDSRDDVLILAESAEALGKETGDRRFADYWRFILNDKAEGVKHYIQRLLDASTTTRGYRFDDIMAGKFGDPGVALMLFRTYPRIPFYENVHDGLPFWTDTGRLNAYCDIPEAIAHGENFIVHREGPEATPYLPNVIVSSNPLVRPDDFGIPRDARHWDERTIRNLKLPWSEVQMKITKAEDGGLHGKGPWEPGTAAVGPCRETPENQAYLSGSYVRVTGKS
jgi:hypothetical protein